MRFRAIEDLRLSHAVFIEDVIFAHGGGNTAVKVILSDAWQPTQAPRAIKGHHQPVSSRPTRSSGPW